MIYKKTPKSTIVMSMVMLVTFVIGLAACSDLNLDATEGEGTVNFHMANIPAVSQSASANASDNSSESIEDLQKANIESLQEVNIDVQEVRIHFSASRADTVNADSISFEEDGPRRWITVPVEPFTVNLLDITDSDLLFSTAELPEGFYSQIRLVLGQDSEVVDENGDKHALNVPSGQQSGYKIKFDTRLHSGEILDLTINFDAEESIHVTGNNRYMLHPVLQVYTGIKQTE